MSWPNHTDVLVFDTGPLSHFAQQGWLGILRTLVDNHYRKAVIPDTVVEELRAGVVQGHTHPQLVLEASWIEHHTLEEGKEIGEFARFSSLLVAGGRNTGESGVLAYAKAHGATAIIDDGPARKNAQDDHVPCKGTLKLLCELVHNELVSKELIANLADHLLEGDYRLPFPTGGFVKWATDQGLLPTADE